jgi:hypothetical protein
MIKPWQRISPEVTVKGLKKVLYIQRIWYGVEWVVHYGMVVKRCECEEDEGTDGDGGYSTDSEYEENDTDW